MAPSRPPTRLFRPFRAIRLPASPSFANMARLLPPLLLGAALLWPGQAGAAVNRKPGNESGAWNNSSAWDSGKQPGPGDSVNLSTTEVVPCTLELDASSDTNISSLRVTTGAWNITGTGADRSSTLNTTGRVVIDNIGAARPGLSLENLTLTTGADGEGIGAAVYQGTLKLINATLNTKDLVVGDANKDKRGTLDLSGSGESGQSVVTANNLKIAAGSTYTDDTHSTITLTGNADFGGTDPTKPTNPTINGHFTADGKVTIYGSGFINSQALPDGQAGFSSKGLETSGNLFLGQDAFVTLKDGDLTVRGIYADAANSKVTIDGLADFKGDATVSSTDFIAGSLATAASAKLTLTPNAHVTLNAQNYESVLNGALELGDGSTLDSTNGAGILFNGTSSTYTDTAKSVVNLDGKAVFANTAGNTILGDFIAKGMRIDGTGTSVNAVQAKDFNLNEGDLHIADGGNTLDAGAHALNLGALTLETGSTLRGGALTVHGAYADASTSTVQMSDMAHFANGRTDNEITGNFSAQGMVISGQNTQVTVRTDPASFNLNANGNKGDLTIFDGNNALHVDGHDLDLLHVALGTGSRLTAKSLAVAATGSYSDSPDSSVILNGAAIFNGQASINAQGNRAADTPGFSAASLTAKTLRLGENAYARSTTGAAITDNLTMRPGSLLRAATGDITLGSGANPASLVMDRHSQIHAVDGSITLDPGVVLNIDLNGRNTRDQNPTPALLASGKVVFNNNALSLWHSGDVAQAGSWTLVEAPGGVENYDTLKTTIDTASLHGQVNLKPAENQMVFEGAYTPMTNANLAFLAASRPNARRAAAGFADAFNNRRTPFMHSMDAAYSNMAALEADVARNLQSMTAEAAVTHAAQTQRAHIDIANAALGYALGADAPLAAQGFVPNLHASLMQMGQQANPFQDQQQRNFLASRQRVSLSGPDSILARQQHYSVLGNWQPASQRARQLVAHAAPVAGMAAGNSGIPGIKVWGGYVASAVQQQKKDGYAGYSEHQNGFLVGGSVDVMPALTVGLYGGWTTGNSSAQGISSDIGSNSVHLGGFFRFKGQEDAQGLNVTGDLAYSTTHNDSTRTVPLSMGRQQMTASYQSQVISGGLEAAYDYVPAADEYTRVTPFVGGRYSHLSQNGYTEKGTLPVKVGSISNAQFDSTVGVRAARDFMLADDSVVLTPRVSAAWLRNWSNDQLSARSNFAGSPIRFDTRSVPMDRDAAQLGAGLDLRLKQDAGWDFGIKAAYGLDLRASSSGHNFFGGLELNF